MTIRNDFEFFFGKDIKTLAKGEWHPIYFGNYAGFYVQFYKKKNVCIFAVYDREKNTLYPKFFSLGNMLEI